MALCWADSWVKVLAPVLLEERGTHERDVIDPDAFTQIMAGVGLLGAPAEEGGLGDEQAMRILSGRRLRDLLTELARWLSVRDSAGNLVDFQCTHRFRHTEATSLLNSGCRCMSCSATSAI